MEVGHLSARKGSIASRGTTIITQKENKGEYRGVGCDADNCWGGYANDNETWKWNNTAYDRDIYAHVFDQNGKYRTTDNIPIRYPNNSANYWNSDNIPQCSNYEDYDNPTTLLEKAKGLYGNNYEKIIKDQYSCRPYPNVPGLNAGNWYNFPAATAGSNNDTTVSEKDMPNSICPKGWRLPPNDGNKSYNNLIRSPSTYNISLTTSDSQILTSPLSFVRLGEYRYNYGSLGNRGYSSNYWSSTASSSVGSSTLAFTPELINPQYDGNKPFGVSIRCVSR